MYLPVAPLGYQYCLLTASASLVNPGTDKEYVASVTPGVGANEAVYIQVRDLTTYAITDSANGGPSGAARAYYIQFSYITA